jgi:hypothetical protein
LLYEIAEAFKANVFEETEKEELLKIYEVTEDEVETIFLDFYNYFENKIKLTEKEQRRKEEISDIAKKWYYLSGDERKDILDINNVTNYPIIRPVACFDKLEIIDIAKKIDTYETSILPYEDCCTIFLPKHPVINPDIDKAVLYEKSFDYESLINAAIENEEVIKISNKKKDFDI